MRHIFRGVTCFIFAAIVANIAVAQDDFSTSPKLNNGKKWRIGYYESGEYFIYQKTLIGLVNGLSGLGWLSSDSIPTQKGEQTIELWNWLADNVKSDYVEFIKDAHYTAQWNDQLRPQIAAKIIDRLKNTKDIDLMIAMGTWAGQDLANDEHSTPVIVMGTSDAVAAHIIASTEDSGRDHIHARVDPSRFERQVSIFHDIIGFQTLGIAYEDTVDGRSYAAIDRIEKIAQEQGVEIKRCFLKNLGNPTEEEQLIQSCFAELSQKVQAIYVTVYTGITKNSLPKLVEIANAAKIPTFSQAGSEEVEYGLLMSISQAGFKYIGDFEATVLAKVFNGAKPRQIGQLFEEPPRIAINLKTAEIIGFDPPVDVLGAADEIYQEIKIPASE